MSTKKVQDGAPALVPAVYPMQMEACADIILTAPADCCVVVAKTTDTFVRLRVLPTPAGICRILDARFGPMGWCRRHYNCGSALYCSIGIYNPVTGDYLHKDAPAHDDYIGGDKATLQDASSFAHAAALWGICEDVLALPAITFTAQQVEIQPVPDARNPQRIASYRMRQILTVDKFARKEDGTVAAVQYKDQDGKVAAVWQR